MGNSRSILLGGIGNGTWCVSAYFCWLKWFNTTIVIVILLAKVRGTAARSHIVSQSGVLCSRCGESRRTIYSQRGVSSIH